MKKAIGIVISLLCFHIGFGQIGGPPTGVVGQSPSYTYHDLTNYTTFVWTVTGGGNGTPTGSIRVGQNYIGTIRWDTPGTSTVNFLGNGNLLGSVFNVVVSCPTLVAPTATFTYPNTTTACASVPINYAAGNNTTGLTWYWQTTATGTSTTNSTTSFTATTNGTYYLRAKCGSTWGPAAPTASVVVNANPATPSVPTAASNTCGPRILSKNGSPPAGVSWFWQGTNPSGTDNTSGTATAATYSASISGTTTYYLRSRSTAGCWGASSSLSVLVNPYPVAPSAPIASTNTCDAKTVTKGTPPGGVGWYWEGTNPGGQDYTSAVATAPTYNITTSGTYYLGARSTAGCWTYTPFVVTTYPADVDVSTYDPLNTVIQATHSIRLLPTFATTGGIFTAKIAFTSECNDYVNWTEQLGYDQNGLVISRSRNYSDGYGKALQNQALDFQTGRIWASQPLYDNLNTAAGATLSAPLVENDFIYKRNFVQNLNGDWYSGLDFDQPVGSPGEVMNPKPVGNQPGSLGWYYSAANNLEGQTPVTSYPYTRSYSLPGPDPVSAKSASAGDALRMGVGHEGKSDRYLITSGELTHYSSVRHHFVAENLNTSDILNIYKPVNNVFYLFSASGAVSVAPSAPYVMVTCNTNTGTPGVIPISGPNTVTAGNWYTFKVKGYKTSTQAADLSVTTSAGVDITPWPGPAIPTGGSQYEAWTSVYFQVPAGITSIKLGVRWSQPLTGDKFYISDVQLKPDAPVPVTGYKYVSTDQDGKQTVRFVNADGQTIATALVITANYVPNPPVFTYDNWNYNFYNEAGQVVATMSPKGYVAGDYTKPNYVITYQYDAIGQMIEKTSPDQGTSQFVYNKAGKIRFSQNQAQRNATPKRFSFTNYDRWGRQIESGEYTSGYFTFESSNTPIQSQLCNSVLKIVDGYGFSGTDGGLTAPICADPNKKYLDATGTTDVTKIYYDFAQADLPSGTQSFLYGRVAKTTNANSTTWYSYDEFGHVVWTKQNMPAGPGLKTIDYTYDYFGNTTELAYQKTQPDAFYHHFSYDLNNKLITAKTSKDGVNKTLQATYYYYLHGPLKRIELATNLQGIDYVYNISGALKSINSMDIAKDPGSDGAGVHAGISPDLFGMTLNYYDNDYVGASYNAGTVTASGLVNSYSGVIKSASWFTPIDYPSAKKIYGFTYDGRNQLQNAKWGTVSGTAGSYAATFSPVDAFKEGVSNYDKNGNIVNLLRNDKAGSTLGNYTYVYETNTNRLDKVNNNTGTLITDYTYNAIGQMTQQADGADIRNVTYNIYGLVKEIRDGSATPKLVMTFAYDDRGARIQRTVYDATGVAAKNTYYMRDVRGNVMAIFEQKLPGGTVQLVELPIYGMGRIGEYKPVPDAYFYEVSDHQGNVRAVIGPPKTEIIKATMESEVATDEDKKYKNIAPRIVYAAANNTPGGNEAVRVNNGTVNGGYAGRIAGPGISLKVAPGDVITVDTYGYYEGGTGYTSQLAASSIIAAAAGVFGGVSGVSGDPGKIFTAFNQTYTVGGFVGGGGTGSNTEPAAYLNMIMFDQNLIADPTNLPMAAVKVTSAANFARQHLTIGPITIPAPGYVYIYVNDNSNVNNWVYFDDLQVTQLHSPFVAGGDYYPFGLAINERQIKIEPYRYGFQGQFAEKDTITNWNAFKLRMFDPRYGRWLSIDPKGQYANPYLGMGNNPANGIDRDGGFFEEEEPYNGWYLNAEGHITYTDNVNVTSQLSMAFEGIEGKWIGKTYAVPRNGIMTIYEESGRISEGMILPAVDIIQGMNDSWITRMAKIEARGAARILNPVVDILSLAIVSTRNGFAEGIYGKSNINIWPSLLIDEDGLYANVDKWGRDRNLVFDKTRKAEILSNTVQTLMSVVPEVKITNVGFVDKVFNGVGGDAAGTVVTNAINNGLSVHP